MKLKLCISFLSFYICNLHQMCIVLFNFFLILWQANLGFLLNTHLLLGFACVLSLMENMQSLLKFVQRKDIFICDLITSVKVCQHRLYQLYNSYELGHWLKLYLTFHICFKWKENMGENVNSWPPFISINCIYYMFTNYPFFDDL
jgi:hypothetical protein